MCSELGVKQVIWTEIHHDNLPNILKLVMDVNTLTSPSFQI